SAAEPEPVCVPSRDRPGHLQLGAESAEQHEDALEQQVTVEVIEGGELVHAGARQPLQDAQQRVPVLHWPLDMRLLLALAVCLILATATCPPGSHRAPGEANCTDCPHGTYSSQGGECTDCLDGQVALEGQKTCVWCPSGHRPSRDRSHCVPCQPGTF